MTWIREGNLLYEERSIESWKSDVYDKNKSYLDRWIAIKRLEKLLNKEDFKEIEPEYILFKKEMLKIFEE